MQSGGLNVCSTSNTGKVSPSASGMYAPRYYRYNRKNLRNPIMFRPQPGRNTNKYGHRIAAGGADQFVNTHGMQEGT